MMDGMEEPHAGEAEGGIAGAWDLSGPGEGRGGDGTPGVRQGKVQRRPHTRSQARTTAAGFNFYKQHILGVASDHKDVNHKGSFHKAKYMKVLKHPPKLKNQTRSGQSSYITKDELEVVEIGRHSVECLQSLGFVICGRDQDVEGVPGVISEHLSKNLRQYGKTKLKNEALTKVETSRGNFIVESEERVYSGPTPPGDGYETQSVQKETEDYFSAALDPSSTTDYNWTATK